VQDVDAFLVKKGIRVADLFDPGREAILDDEHQVRINYEAFFFADTESRNRFAADPRAFCGLLTDPVSKTRFRPDNPHLSVRHGGVLYYFPNTSSWRRFLEDPERYVLPGYVM